MQNINIIVGASCLIVGVILGYLVRHFIGIFKSGSTESKLQQKIQSTKEEAKIIILKAKEEATKIITDAQAEERERKSQLDQLESRLLKREEFLDQKQNELEQERKKLMVDIEKVKGIKEELVHAKEIEDQRLEQIAAMSKEEAKNILVKHYEDEHKEELLKMLKDLEQKKREEIEKQVEDIIINAIQRYGHGNASENMISTVAISSEDMKGRIIGKEGRNIHHFEKVSGVEVIIDDSPDIITLSSFNPIRREIARIALEKLIQDGRIQPAKIEEKIAYAEQEVKTKIKKVGEDAVYEAGLLDLPPELVTLLGRLNYRTSYGQNVLTHSLEVASLASMLASELGANVEVAKKAGLLHDIGKAVDYEIEGSHIDIGIRILQKYGISNDIITAMKSHHEDYPIETLEAAIIAACDAISASRPGARKENLENYLRRLENLEKIATSFPEVEKAYAIQAGRELRVFVFPDKIDDYGTMKLAKTLAQKIEEEIKYPGEIRITMTRETKVIEIAR